MSILSLVVCPWLRPLLFRSCRSTCERLERRHLGMTAVNCLHPSSVFSVQIFHLLYSVVSFSSSKPSHISGPSQVSPKSQQNAFPLRCPRTQRSRQTHEHDHKQTITQAQPTHEHTRTTNTRPQPTRHTRPRAQTTRHTHIVVLEVNLPDRVALLVKVLVEPRNELRLRVRVRVLDLEVDQVHRRLRQRIERVLGRRSVSERGLLLLLVGLLGLGGSLGLGSSSLLMK